MLLAVALAMYMVIVKIAPHSGGTSLILAMVRGAAAVVTLALPLSAYVRRPHLLQVLRRELVA